MRFGRLVILVLGASLLAAQCWTAAISPGPFESTADASQPKTTSPSTVFGAPTTVITAAAPTTSTTVPPHPTTTTTTTTTTTGQLSPCRIRDPGPIPPGTENAQAALRLSQRGFTCADHVTISVDDPSSLSIAAVKAVEKGGPLLLASDTVAMRALADEVVRLRPRSMTIVGDVDLPADVIPANVSRPGIAVMPEPDTPPLPDVDRETSGVWVIAGDDLAAALPPAVMASALGQTVRFVGNRDIRSLGPGASEDLRLATDLRTVGVLSDSQTWQLAVVRRGLQLPGGGQLVFRGKRLVAAFGTPGLEALGVLGETEPPESLERLLGFAEGYDADGRAVVPTFEIIATVASAGAGPDEDYSDEIALDVIRPWIEFAAEHGVYVILDLQPGRTEFLSQAKRYEEFLRLPHVGLALDPEWRLGPDQVHLRQIGSVDASEINQVSRWLADLTRQSLLPQKLLLIHQFKLSMIEHRELIETPAELAVAIQMDGQGPLATKYDTFAALVAGTDGAGWQWGWKNFFDEDSPTAEAHQVLSLDPVPVMISFQ